MSKWGENIDVAQLSDAIPGYIADAHGMWLVGASDISGATLEASGVGSYSYNAVSAVESAIALNPYSASNAYDPTTEMNAATTELAAAKAIVDALDVVTNITSYATTAASLYDDNVVDTASDADDFMTAYESQQDFQHARAVAAFMSGMHNINMIESSPFVVGLAVLEAERQVGLNSIRAQALMQAKRDKNVFLLQALQTMVGMQTRDVEMARQISLMQSDLSRMRTIAFREQYQQDLEYDVADVIWELEQIKSGVGVLGGLGGAPLIEKKPSQLSTALTNALSIGPAIGLAVGQGTGSVPAGLLTGLIGSFLAAQAALV